MKNKFDKIIDWLVIAFIFLLPWQTRLILRPGKIGNGASEYLTISLYAIDLLALLIAALYLWSNGSIWQKLRTSRKAMCIVPIFLLFFAVNIAFSADRLLAAYVWLRLTVAMTLFLAVKEKVPWRKITLGFVFGLLLPSWLAIWQFLYQGTFANKWLGLAEHVASDPGTSVIEVYPIGQKPERWLRAYGSFDHPNILGGVMAAGLLLSLWMLSRAEKDGNDRFKPFYYLAVASFAGALFVSFSRAAWLGLLLALVMILFFELKEKFSSIKFWLPGIVIGIVAFSALLVPYHSLLETRLSGTARLEQKSLDERAVSYKDFYKVIKKHWLSGTGFGNFIPLSVQMKNHRFYWEYQPVHNTYLLVFSEMGVLGMFLLIIFNFKIRIFNQIRNSKFEIRNFLSRKSVNPRKMQYGLVALLLVIAAFDHWLWSLHFGVFFVCVIAVIANKKAVEF